MDSRPARRFRCSTSHLAVALAPLLLAACATVPAPIRGEFSQFSPEQSQRQAATGASLRWGGSLISVEPEPARTCFVVLSRPLGSSGRPQANRESSDGRFIACRAGFYDPALFAEGRDVTFTGRLDRYETRLIGGVEYRYPVLEAEVVYLWPEPVPALEPRTARPYWGPYWGPWWGPRVIWW